MATKKVKVKVKKKKINIKKITIMLLILAILIISIIQFTKIPVKNIYISGNNIVSDKEIIKLSELETYPSYISTYLIDIKENVLKNNYIKSVKIKRKLPGKIYIEVEEYKPICIYKNKLVLSSTIQVENKYNIDYIPYIINNIDRIYDEFVRKFSHIDYEIINKISHIEYKPNDVDKERFLLYMVDSNYVYITLTKIEKINKYDSIINELDGKKGIIYLDSGDYIEIKG